MNILKKISDFFGKYMALIVLAVAALALFVPSSTLWIKTKWVNYLLMIVMFGMGLTLRLEDFKVVFTRPKDIICGCISQFIVMPGLAFLLSKLFHLDAALMAGVVLVGTCPGGTSSNVITYLSKGDVALSVGMTSVNTILAPVLTPLITYFLLRTTVEVNALSMFISILEVVIVPIGLGFLINKFFGKFTQKVVSILPVVSVIAICMIVAAVVSHNSQKILTTSAIVFVVVILHNLLGYGCGFAIGKILHLNPAKTKALSIEVGMQNSGLATSLAGTAFPALAMATVPGAVFSVWHNISGAILANIYNHWAVEDPEEERLVQITPSKRQMELQKMEFYAFVHFTVNTFTDKEWGDGTENPQIFNPEKLDAMQWCNAIKAAGMKGLILTCKHHDGLCLWPSKFTNHTVAASPYKNGKGDIVKEVSEACKKTGLKFGIYLSPWDRNNPVYGQGKAYDDYFCSQLTELLTGYGPVFSVWFDGACGEGPNGKKQVYDFERYYSIIRKLQPDACISVCGPDVRWCGNEAGHSRKSEWSVVPLRTKDTEIIKERSQKEDSAEFREREIFASDEDLGSREILKNEKNLIWYPAEVNTSIRPGWFYHKSEDDKVKSLDELKRVYLNSAGGNATFLLNIPPAPDGLFHKNDVLRLKELGDFLQDAFGKPVLEDRKVKTVNKKEDKKIFEINEEFPETEIKYVIIQENIEKSQRVEEFEIFARQNSQLVKIYTGTTIGYKKIAVFDEKVKCDGIKIAIKKCRCEPQIGFVGIY